MSLVDIIGLEKYKVEYHDIIPHVRKRDVSLSIMELVIRSILESKTETLL